MRNRYQRGVAIFEFAFLLFILLFAFVLILGSWGITRPAILHSIAARTYLWYEVNQRDNMIFLRDREKTEVEKFAYWSLGSRVYRIVKPNSHKVFIPPKRKMDLGGRDWSDIDSPGWLGLDPDPNNEERGNLNNLPSELAIKTGNLDQGPFERNQSYKASVVFLRMSYGICVNSECQVAP